nr:SDR family oxidoreductase [uncultured Halomonas sp.]
MSHEPNDQIQGKVVVITGASSGLGAETARHLAKRGAKLVLAARRKERLDDLAKELKEIGAEASIKATDVTDRSQVEALVKHTTDTFGRLDVMINNAGLMPLSPLAEGRIDEWEQMIDVNVKGVMYGIYAALPVMNQQQSGHFINLSSVAGHVVFPGSAVYSASKFAVWALSEGLRKEAGPNIRTTTLSPGAVQSELPQSVGHDETSKQVNDLYEMAIPAASVARAIVYAIEQPADVDINEVILRPTAQEM